MTFPYDERFEEGLTTLYNQLSPMVRELVDPAQTAFTRHFRFALATAIYQDQSADLTVDQVHATVLGEYLAFGQLLSPAAFNPAQTSPASQAQAKAGGFAFTYLMNRYLAGLSRIGTPTGVIANLTTDAGDFALAQIQRLRFNYNRYFKVADYLADCKARAALLATMTAKLSAHLAGQGPAVSALIEQVAEALACAVTILHESATITGNPPSFTPMVIRGTYPLALIFAREEDPWIADFFRQPHRPQPGQFDQLARLVIERGIPRARDLARELLSQCLLDLRELPGGACKDGLRQIIHQVQ